MKGLSEKETKVIAELEFDEKQYFTREDIRHHFENEAALRNTIHRLLAKKRIISLNRSKYYLISIKAKTGKWADDPFILADEIFNGKDYYIGGWSAANYWRLTDQVPMKIEVYSTKRQGTRKLLNTTFIFRRIRPKRLGYAMTQQRNGHGFRILNKEETTKWMKSRN